MTNAQTETEKAYIAVYRDVVRLASNVETFVSPALRAQYRALEKTMSTDQIERLRNIARNSQ